MTASYPSSIKSFAALVNNVDRVQASHPNERGEEITAIETWLFRALALGAHVDSRTLSTVLTLVDGDKAIQKIDCNGASRDVAFPAVATTNHVYYVANVSTGGYIITTLNAGGNAFGTVLPGEVAIVLPTGAGWYRLCGRLETDYKIVPTVSSNNLTVALKHLDGTDPSTVRPLWFKIGTTWRALTAALSVTKAAATNWCNAGRIELATLEADYFVYAIWNTGPATDVVDIGFSRIPWGAVYSQFSGTTTADAYLAYGNATPPASTDDVINIGRFADTLSAGAGYTWSVPTFTSVNLRHVPTFETRRLSYTPVGTSQTGTITTMGTCVGSYHFIGIEMFFDHSLTITTNGTGGGAFRASLPITPASNNAAIPGRETGLTGNTLNGITTPALVQYTTVANAYPGASGAIIIGGGNAIRLI